MLGKILKKVPRRIYFDRHDPSKAAILAGSGRSGTTWVGEVLGSISGYRSMFEPFYARETALIAHWSHRQYLRPGERRPAYVEPARKVLAEQVRSPWIDKCNTAVFPRGRLIKDIRIQLLLPWINTTFPEIPVAIILRHPCAVALSRQALGWKIKFDDMLGQEQLIEDHLSPFLSEMRNERDDFEKQIVFWSAENRVPLKHFAGKNYVPVKHSPGDPPLVIRYEDICRNPEAEFGKLATFFGWAMRPTV